MPKATKKAKPADELVSMIDRLTKALVISLNRESSERIRVLDAIGYSSPQIATLLGTTSENIRQTLHRLKTKKRKKRSRRNKTEATA